MEISQLKEIGLTSGEIRIYQALLDSGETTRNDLAKKSGVSPSKIYDVIDRLSVKGLVSSVRKQGVLHFSPASPQRLRDFIEKKESDISREKDIVAKMLPLLMQKYTRKKESVDIEVFYGWEGMKTVYDDIINSLQKGEENLIFGASKGEDVEKADKFFSRHYKNIRKKGIRIKIIFNENLRNNITRTAYYRKYHEVRFLHQDTFTELNMYKDTVLFIMLLKKPVVIRIHSKEASDSFRKFFDAMWNMAKK